ncbi:MAG: ATP-dependent DNA helicase RecQ [Selenomonas ruminantium]|jgi:superfamily II DNA/RNA helicase|nr:ATP-dependent DNA helicase RecQ [Selenomonas ruminantium]
MDQKQIEKVSEILAAFLMERYGHAEARRHLERVQAHPSFISPALRLIDTLKQDETFDFLGHLRQCLLYCRRPLPLSVRLQELVEREGKRFGLIVNDAYVDALPCMMADIDGLESNYQFVMRRKMHRVVSDGRMYRYYRYETYTSLAQKAINYYIANMEPGETFLACLPTGGGKSLAWQLPAISHMWPGTIIVVVPTIALALDHESSSKDMMQDAFGGKGKVMAYTPSDMDEDDRGNALTALEEGKLSILYISPEALMQESFKQSLLDAAQDGHVSALVVDEAHLVVNWGMQFRTDFQLLPVLRNQLDRLSPEGIRTMLLTATLTAEDSAVLRKLFASAHFTELRADSLREEPSYYTQKCENEAERRERICQLLGQVPRPVIIYVGTVQQSTEYLKMVRECGYCRVASLSSRTGTEARKQLIEQWNNDEIDIMIATAAFGMGMDKSDVRTIITAYMPESISRFYQEVGRAGRDGYASLNYWLCVKRRDKDVVRKMMSKQVVGVDNLVARWQSLRKGEKVLGHPDWLIIDKDMKPKHLEDNITGKQNANWNKDVVMMLYRAGLIDIIDCDIVRGKEDIYRVTVQMKDLECLQDERRLSERMEPFREQERESVDAAMTAVERMLAGDRCIADSLIDTFWDDEVSHMIPYTCHGCPYCRAEGELTCDAGEANIDMHFWQARGRIFQGPCIPFDADMREQLAMGPEIALLRRESDEFVSMVAYMVRNQVNIIVADDFSAEGLLPALARYDQYDYLLLTLSEANALLDCGILDGTCALFYTSNEDELTSYQQFGKNFLEDRENTRLIHVFYEKHIASEDGRQLTDRLPSATWIGNIMEDSGI